MRSQLEDGFDIEELDKYTAELFDKINKDTPRKTNGFLKKEGNKLRNKTLQKAKSKLKKPSNGKDSYLKSIKAGKPYEYGTNEKAIRVYSSAPHAHLIEDGYDLIKGGKKGEGGKKIIFVKGKRIFQDSHAEFQNQFIKDVEIFVDDVFKKL